MKRTDKLNNQDSGQHRTSFRRFFVRIRYFGLLNSVILNLIHFAPQLGNLINVGPELSILRCGVKGKRFYLCTVIAQCYS